MRQDTLRLNDVETIPRALEEGVLYVSQKYKTAAHLCCCGCGNKVVTPLKPGSWRLEVQAGTPSLYPSVGNWSLPCQSHYVVRRGHVNWAKKFSLEKIQANREHDRILRDAYLASLTPSKSRSLWWRALHWLRVKKDK